MLNKLGTIYFDQAFYSKAYHPELYGNRTIEGMFNTRFVSDFRPLEVGTNKTSLEESISKSITTNQDNTMALNVLQTNDFIMQPGITYDHYEFYTMNSAFYASYASLESLQDNYFYLDPAVEYHTREVYHILHFIGDLGGLFDGLKYICFLLLNFLSLLGYDPLANYLADRIYSDAYKNDAVNN